MKYDYLDSTDIQTIDLNSQMRILKFYKQVGLEFVNKH